MKTMINIKTDVEIKNQAKKVAKELGIPLGTVLNAYLREFIQTKTAHFSLVPRMTKTLELLLGSVEKDVRKRKNLSQTFSSDKEAISYLNNL
ncbi:MAG: hypothetical protein WAX44_02370 [Minisyncoccia bacterium]